MEGLLNGLSNFDEIKVALLCVATIQMTAIILGRKGQAFSFGDIIIVNSFSKQKQVRHAGKSWGLGRIFEDVLRESKARNHN
jgi:hypothetical protein